MIIFSTTNSKKLLLDYVAEKILKFHIFFPINHNNYESGVAKLLIYSHKK